MKTVELHEVTKIIAGQSPKSEYYNDKGEGVPFFQGKADFGDTYPTVTTWCTKPKKMAKEGDILFSVRAPVGPTNIAKVDCCIGRGLSAIRAGKDIDRRFLRYFFKKIEQQLSDQGRGSTFKAITQKDLKALKIPLPSLSEQKAIVAKLDRAQRLIDIDKEMLAKYDQLIQSVFLEMFGDPVTNPKGWEVKKLGDVVEKLIAGKSFKSTDDDSGDYRVIKTGAVSWNTFDKSESKALPPDYEPPSEHLINKGDILISRMNTSELVGASVLIRDEIENYTIPDRIWKVKWKSKDSQTLNYFWQCINHNSFRNEISKIATGTSGSMKNMSKKKMFNMNVILPPIELQKEFDEICEKIESQKKELYESLKKSEALFSSLVQEVFG